MAVNIVNSIPHFHYFSAVRVGCNGHVASRVQVDTDPAFCHVYCWIKSDHLSPLVGSTALRNTGICMDGCDMSSSVNEEYTSDGEDGLWSCYTGNKKD